jgi:RNA polymerase sigma factor (sigma-70 family)
MSPILSLRPLQTQPDAKLIALARDGHERAFEALVRRYRRQLLAYANRLLGAEGRAEDALQHALLQAWIALRADADVKDARAWLYRIVHNSAVNTLRRPRHETVELNEALDASASDDGPESRVLVGEILTSLAALPDLQRRAMVMTAIRGDSHGEAAATLGLTDGAVRGLVYRARTTMRDAAAALMPVGLFNWAAGASTRRGPLGTNTSEMLGTAGGMSSAGLAAAVLKGGAVVATAGALATAGHFAIPDVFGSSRTAHPAALSAHPASLRLHAASSDAGASSVSTHNALASASSVFERHGGPGAFDDHHRNGGSASGLGQSRGGSGRSGGSGDHGSSSGATGGGQGGSSDGGDRSGHGGSTSSTGGSTSGPSGGSGDGGSGGNNQSSGDGSHGSTIASSPSSGSGGDSSSGSSGSSGGSHDGSSSDGGGTNATALPAGSSTNVSAPVEVSGGDGGGGSSSDSGTGSGGTNSGSSTDSASTDGSGGSPH